MQANRSAAAPSTAARRVGDGAGFNAYTVRTSNALEFVTGLEITRTGETFPLATTQHHHSMEGRDFIRVATLDQVSKGRLDFGVGRSGL